MTAPEGRETWETGACRSVSRAFQGVRLRALKLPQSTPAPRTFEAIMTPVADTRGEARNAFRVGRLSPLWWLIYCLQPLFARYPRRRRTDIPVASAGSELRQSTRTVQRGTGLVPRRCVATEQQSACTSEAQRSRSGAACVSIDSYDLNFNSQSTLAVVSHPFAIFSVDDCASCSQCPYLL